MPRDRDLVVGGIGDHLDAAKSRAAGAGFDRRLWSEPCGADLMHMELDNPHSQLRQVASDNRPSLEVVIAQLIPEQREYIENELLEFLRFILAEVQ